MSKPPAQNYDMVIFGGGIAGLWLANTLKRAGYNVIVIEKDKVGAGQTLAAQGMIHGGQKYAATGENAAGITGMPAIWEACLGGWGEIDLTSVKVLSEQQIMWPAGSLLSEIAVLGAAKLVNAATRKMKKDEFPDVLKAKKKFKGPVYALPEKVLDMRSLLQALLKNLKTRVLKGELTELLPDGQAAVSGQVLRAQLMIFTAGAGNEQAFELLKIKDKHTQRRPLRQVMVRVMQDPIYGHGIVGAPKPRLTITSHPLAAVAGDSGGYVWYIGGNIAEEAWKMDDAEAIQFAKKELQDVFPEIDWSGREWATWYGDRAEPFDAAGNRPSGPFLHQRGKVVFAWPSKLTFAPGLSARVFDWLKDKDIHPLAKDAPPDLPTADIGSYPWETATWQRID